MKKVFESLIKLVDGNLPKILTVTSMLGVVATGGLAIKATLDIREKEEPTKLDYVKAYAPPVISCIGTLASIVGLNHVHIARYAALTSLYVASQSDLKQYKDKAKEFLGVEKAKEIEEECKKERKQAPVYIDQNREQTVLDLNTGRYFASSVIKIGEAATRTNQLIVQEGRACLNDFYKFLGLDEVELGNLVQWHQGDTFDVVDIAYGADLTRDMKPILTITYDITDHYSW